MQHVACMLQACSIHGAYIMHDMLHGCGCACGVVTLRCMYAVHILVADLCMDMVMDMCIDMHMNTYMDICIDMYMDMCIDMYMDMCIDM